MSELEQRVLTASASLIERMGWRPGLYASDATGRAADPRDATATTFSLLGALITSAADLSTPNVSTLELYDECRTLLRANLGVRDLSEWEDQKGRTRDDVIAALRQTAETARDHVSFWTPLWEEHE